jgi:zinc protease
MSGPLVGAGFPADSELSDYARTGLASLSTFQLGNGIPVVVRKNSASPVRNISLVIRGGSAASTMDKAGCEFLALRTMVRGGSKYSYKDIQDLLDATSGTLAAGSGLDYSIYSLTCLSKYFDRLLPVWSDTLTAPAFTPQDFAQALSEARLTLQSKEKDPWQKTGLVMNAEFFEGHPYAVPPEGTKDSLAGATIDDVKAWYATAFSADRLFVVAAGDFDPVDLQKSLEAAIGSIPNHGAGIPPRPAAFGGEGAGRLVKVEFPSSQGIAYVRGDFAAPSPRDPDYMAANIAMKMFSDLLFNVVRDLHGAVYSPAAYIRSYAANYGSIVMYKTNMPGKIKAYIDEAARDFEAGKVLDMGAGPISGGKTPDAEGAAAAKHAPAPRMDLEDALEVYKAQFTNEYFEKLGTNAQIADLIAQSVAATGDCRAWLLSAQQIEAVTADAVKSAAAKYLFGGRITWVALGASQDLVPVVEADYETLGGK